MMNTFFTNKDIKKGSTVTYELREGGDPEVAKVIGFGRKEGERVAYLDNGRWCYLMEISGIE